jgi:hypothetical protein
MGRGLSERRKSPVGSKVRLAMADMEPKEHASPNLAHCGIPQPVMVTIKCEGCGCELQVPDEPKLYACPEPDCRGYYWFPCEICPQDKRKCKGRTCTYDDGHYIEAVKIMRGGAKR